MKAIIIDDNNSLRALYKLYFQELGFEADEAPDGGVAFQMLKTTDYDVIMSDMNMPAVNGMELYRLVKKYMPHLISRIVFATGNDFDCEFKKFIKKIPCPVLLKPFSLHNLTSIVGLLLKRHNRSTAALAVSAFGAK